MSRADTAGAEESSSQDLAAMNRAILDSALDCIISMDATGRVREFNPAAERTFGYRRDEAIGRELAELIIPPELRERHREGLARFLKTGEGPVLGRRIEINALRQDGTEIMVELAINVTRIGGTPFFTAYLRDVTERNRRDETLSRLAAIVESSDDAIISTDLEMTITSWNRGAEQLFGYDANEAIGRPITLLIPENRQSEEPKILERIRGGERIHHYETVRQHKSGRMLNISLTVSPVRDLQGRITGASKIARDITGRVLADRRRLAQYAVASLLAGARTLEEASAAILQTIASIGEWVLSALWLVDDEAGRLNCAGIWQAGSATLEAFGIHSRTMQFAPGEGLPGRVWKVNAPAWVYDVALDPNFPRAQIARTAGLRGGFAFPIFSDHRINGVLEMFSHSVVQPDPDLLQLVGALGSQIGLFIERLRIERELAGAKEKAEAASAAKDKFLAMLSHELRTPLTPVLLTAELLSSDSRVPAELRDGLAMIRRNVELEARLIDDLLDLTRITRGKLRLQFERCDVHEIVRHALETVRSGAPDRLLQIDLFLDASEREGRLDGPRLQQVFWNLIRNAYKFSPLDGRIEIRSDNPSPGTIRVKVTDYGIGLRPESRENIFEAFEQVDQQREGLGLGLAICKAIVEMHGGRIGAESGGLGHGATFLVELPLVAPEPKQGGASKE